MLKFMHRFRLPLAAKCLLLFGAGVSIVLAAALWVPWQRMEQLTQQLDQSTASGTVRLAIGEHTSAWSHRGAAATQPVNQWDKGIARLMVDGEEYLPPRLIPLSALKTPDKLTRFDLQAFQAFASDPRRASFWRYFNGSYGYRYAEPFYAAGECLNCHSAQPLAPELASLLPSRNNPAEPSGGAPTTQPAPLLGMVSVEIPSQIEAQQLLLNRVFMLSAGLIAGLLAIVLFYLITTRLILQPVRVLQETCEKVALGDLNIRSDVNTGDEFQQLSETFNGMLKNMQESTDQLRAVNKSLDMKLGELAQTNVALFESNRLKSEFLANVSHELRTPLNSILGFADLLQGSLSRDADGRTIRYLQNILVSGKGLLQLINDLLDLAKIEAGKMEIRSEPLIMSDLFEGLVNLLKPLTEKKNLIIHATVTNDVPIIQTDSAKVRQILYNFLSNAIKFSPVGQFIDLTADRDGLVSIRLEVTDHGPGISLDQQQLIFEKFRQIDGSHTREHGGTGLGLAIARELAELLGGSVAVRSTAGQGATFSLTLPLKIDAGAKDVREKLVLT